MARGWVAGPFPSPPLPNLQVSSFGVIPKKGQPGKWRLIVDLSSPHGSSVNDGIDPDEFSMHYIHWPGRTFLRHMLDLLCCFRTSDHPIRLSSEFRLDLQWWHDFLISCHGVSFWLFPGMSAPTDVEVTSDAAGSLGFGAFYNNEWFSGAWVPSQADQSIAYKELFPVVVASHIWGSQWSRRHVLFRSDNESVVHRLLARTLKVPCIMKLLCHLLSAAARFNFTFTSQHIPGVHK